MSKDRTQPNIRRTLVIGLGGTGLRTALHIKKTLHQYYGQIPLAAKFLVLDTDPMDRSVVTFGELGGWKEIAMEPREFLYLPVDNPLELIRTSPSIQSWWPEGLPSRAVLNGAGQIRALGRLALHSHAQKVLDDLRRITVPLFDLKLGMDMLEKQQIRLSERKGIEVYIIGSLAGGTASGCFLDVAFLMRHLMKGQVCNIYGYLILPWIFEGLPATGRVQGNTYSALMELDHYMDSAYSEDHAVFRFGQQDVVPGAPPFDMVNLIDGRNENGENIKGSGADVGVGNLCEVISRGITLNISSIGKAGNDAIDNIPKLTGTGTATEWGGKNPHYSSFGVSSVVYPMEKHYNRAYSLYALMLIEDGMKVATSGGAVSNPQEVEGDVDDFTTQAGLRDEGDQVIDSLIGVKAIATDIVLPRSGSADELRRLAELKWKWVEEQLHEHLGKNLAQKKEDSRKALVELLESREKEKGPAYVLALIDVLTGQMDSYRQKRSEEIRKMEDESVRLMQDKEKELLERAQSITKMDKVLRRRRAIYKEYLDHVRRELDQKIEIERRKAALEVFSLLMEQAAAFRKRLSLGDIAAKLSKVREMIHSELFTTTYLTTHYGEYSIIHEPLRIVVKRGEGGLRAEVATSAGKGKGEDGGIDFGQFLKEEGIKVDFNDFLKEYQFASIGRVSGLKDGDLKQKLIAYSQRQVSFVKEMSLEDMLLFGIEAGEEQGEKLKQILKEASSRATPLWYHRAAGELAAKMEEIYILGVENEAKSKFKTGDYGADLLPYLSTRTRYLPNFASTTDPWKLFCFRYKAPLPAYMLRDIEDYRKKYQAIPLSMTYHAERDFELKGPDLLPSGDIEKSYRRAFFLAHSPVFDLIKLTRELRGQRQVEIYQFDGESLGDSATSALSAFGDEKRKRLRERILSTLETDYQRDAARVRQDLQSYLEKRQREFEDEKERVRIEPASRFTIGQEVVMKEEIETIKEFLRSTGGIRDFLAL